MLKDSVITAGQKKREIIIALCCFAAMFLLNVFCVIRYACPWTEIFTQLGFVVVFAVGLYVLTVIVRLIVKALALLFGRCRG